MSETNPKRKLVYIQQKDEFDYLICLIESLEEGRCAGILIYGPPGTGKTLLAISLAKSFKSSYFIIDGSPDLDRRDLEGNWELLKGETKFNYGPLTQAIKKANVDGISFVILNEINAIRESEQISLNSLLSESHINLISKGFERHELNSDNKLVIIGTMNKGVIGISKLQEAFDDRFVSSPEINYPIKSKEIDIASKVSGCSNSVAEIVVDAARQIRKQALDDFSLTKIFSTRLVVNFCSLITRMPPKYLKHNIENAIINKIGDTPEEKKSIAMILDGKMFEKRLKEEILGVKEEPKKPKIEVSVVQGATTDAVVRTVLYNMKYQLTEYIKRFGRGRTIRNNGYIMWKPLQWIWAHNKKYLQDYFKLTEIQNFHIDFKAQTRSNHLYGGIVTLRYIKWVYSQKPNELIHFMKHTYPVLE